MKNFLSKHSATITVVIAIGVSAFLSFTGRFCLEETVNITLIAVGGLAVSMIFTSLSGEKNLRDTVTCLEHRTSSDVFTRREHYEHLRHTLQSVKERVWIMTIDSSLNKATKNTIAERMQYYNNLANIIKTNKHVTVRRIYGLPVNSRDRTDKIEWIRSDIENLRAHTNFHARIFDWKKYGRTTPPPLSLQIIDNSFAGIINPQHSGVDGGGADLCVYDSNMIQYLSMYYDEVWNKCSILKNGDDIFLEILT